MSQVDDDVAQFMQRMKDMSILCDELRSKLDKTNVALEESERKCAFLEEQHSKACLDRDVYHRQYITLHTELTGLAQDAESFRNTVMTSLARSNKATNDYGTASRSEPEEEAATGA